MAKSNQVTFNLGIKTDVDLTGINELKRSLQDIQRIAQKNDKGLFSADEIYNMTTAANDLDTAINRAFDPQLNTLNVNKFTNSLRQSGTSVQQLRENLSLAGESGNKAFWQMNAQLMSVNKVAAQTNNLFNKLATSFLNSLRYQAFNTLINTVSSSIQEAYGYIKRLDASLNDIQIVSEKSAVNMQKFAKEANKAAKSLGASTTDYTDASLIYYQQGLDDQQVQQRTDVTMKMANVLGSDAAEVSDYMTAIWNNFDDGSKSLEYFGDVITKLGATTAASSEEIAQGLEKFAAVSNTVGLSYEYATSALATVVAETRQSADTVGTSFKTLFARIQDLELGKTLDDGTTLGKYSQALAAVGINIKDQNGELKSMDNLLNEMGDKWVTLSKDQQVALAQNVAGTRQYTQLVALMDNWDKVTKNIQTAADATGTLNKKQEIYMDSVAAHIQVLKTEAENLYKNLLDTDTIKNFTDGLTKIVSLASLLTKSIGGIVPILTSITSLAVNNLSNRIVQSLTTIYQNNFNIKQQLASYEESLLSIQSIYGDGSWTNSIALDEQQTVILEKMIQNYQELSEYRHLISDEDKAVFNQLQNDFQILGSTIDKINDAIEDLSVTQIFGGALGSLDKLNDNEISSFIDDLSSINKIVNEIDENSSRLKVGKTINDLGKALASTKFEADNMAKAINKIAGNDFVTVENGVLKIEGDIRNLSENTLTKLKELLIEEGQAGNQALSSILPSIKNVQNGFETLKKKSENLFSTKEIQMQIDSIVKLGSSIGQLASCFMTLNNIADTWKEVANGNQEASEALLQTIMSMSFVLPQMISTIKTFGSNLSGFGNIISAQIALRKASKLSIDAENISNTASMVILQAQNGLVKENIDSIAKECIARELNNDQITKENISNIVTELQLGRIEDLRTEETAAIIAKITALKAEEAATEEMTAAQLTLNAAMEANPLGAVIAILAILVAGVAGAIVLYKKFGDTAENAHNKFLDSLNSYQDTVKELKELNTELETAIDRYTELSNLPSSKLSIVDQKELTSLQLEIALLEQKQKILDKEKKDKAQVVSDAFAKDYEKGNYQDYRNPNYKGSLEDLSLDANTGLEGQINSANYYSDGTKDYGNAITNILGENWKNLSFDNYSEVQNAINKLKQAGAEEIAVKGKKDSPFVTMAEGLEERLQKEQEKAKQNYENLINVQDGAEESIYDSLKLIAESDDATDQDRQNLENAQKAILNYYKIYGSWDELLQTAANTIGEETLSKIQNNGTLTAEEQEQLENIADAWQISMTDLQVSLADNAICVFNAVVDEVTVIENKVNSIKDSLTNLSSVLSKLLSGSDLDEEEIAYLEELESKYKTLSDIKDRTSQRYIKTLREVQDIEERNYREELKKQEIASRKKVSDLEKEKPVRDYVIPAHYEGSNYVGQVVINKEEIASQINEIASEMQKVCDTKYELQLAITNDIITDVDSVISMADAASLAVEKIGEGFKVAAKDAEELFNVYPELANDAQVLADGTIQLNDNVAKTILENSGVIIDADRKTTESKIDNRIVELEATRESIKKQIVFLESGAKTEEEITEALDSMNNLSADYQVKISEEVARDEVANSAESAAAIIENWSAVQDAIRLVGETAQAATAAPFDTSSIASINGSDFTNKLQYSVNETTNTVNNVEKSANEALEEYRQQAIASGESYIDSIDQQIADLTIAKSKLYSSINGIDFKEDDSSSSSRKQEELKSIDDEIDRYYTLNKTISNLSDTISDLDKAKSHLYGGSLISALQQEITLLDSQKSSYEALAEEQKKEQAELQAALSGLVSFNSNGDMANYQDAATIALNNYNAAVAAYNSGALDDAQMDSAKASYDAFKKNVDRYKSLLGEIEDTANKIDDIYYKTLEYHFTEWETSIKINIDRKDLERQWNNLLHSLNTDITLKYIKTDDELAYRQGNIVNSKSTKDSVKELYDEALREAENLQNGGTSDKFASSAEALEKAKEYDKELISSYETLISDLTSVYDLYLQSIDEEASKMSDVMSRFEMVTAQVDHAAKLASLLYGEDDYETQKTIIGGKQQNSLNALSMYSTQAATWKEQYDKAVEEGDEKAAEKYYQLYSDAQKKLWAEEENYTELSLNQLKLEIEHAWDEVGNITTEDGVKLSVSEQKNRWELEKSASSGYYDDVERVYQLDEIKDKYQKAINNTSSIKNQQKLNDLLEKQMLYLENKTDLSEYDIELAEKELAVIQAQIDLEEAQNNKTSMKMVRDESGNWGYQYVADQTEVSDKEDNLEQAAYDVYETTKQRNQDLIDEVYRLEEEYVNTMKDLYYQQSVIEAYGTEEEKKAIQERIDYYTGYYQDNISKTTTALGDNQIQMQTAATASLLTEYSTNVDNFGIMTQTQRDLLEEVMLDGIADASELQKQTNTYLYLMSSDAGAALVGKEGSIEAAFNTLLDNVKKNSDDKLNKDSDSFVNNVKTAAGDASNSFKDGAETPINTSLGNIKTKSSEVFTEGTGSIKADADASAKATNKSFSDAIGNNGDTSNTLFGNFNRILDKSKTIFGNTTTGSGDSVAGYGIQAANSIATAWTKEGGAQKQVTGAINACKDAMGDKGKGTGFIGAMDKGVEAAGEDFIGKGSKKGIAGYIKEATTEGGNLKGKLDTIAGYSKEKFKTLTDALGSIKSDLQGIVTEAENSKKKLEELQKKQDEIDAKGENEPEPAQTNSIQTNSTQIDAAPTQTDTDSVKTDPIKSKTKWYIQQTSTENKHGPYSSESVAKSKIPAGAKELRTDTDGNDKIIVYAFPEYTVDTKSISNNGVTGYNVTKTFNDTKNTKWFKALSQSAALEAAKKDSSFDTGGYTGEWAGGSGRMAMLHSKELVLNASDTENMLQAVSAIREIGTIGSSINDAIASSIANMLVNTAVKGVMGGSSISNGNNGITIQNLTAEFPNANDVTTIKEAIMSLPNIVSQYVNQKNL